jgi:hypothetical protein
MAIKPPALAQLLGGKHREASAMTLVEIALDCRTAKDVALAREPAISLRQKPIIEIVENWSEQWQGTMKVVGFRKQIVEHRILL